MMEITVGSKRLRNQGKGRSRVSWQIFRLCEAAAGNAGGTEFIRASIST